MEYGEGQNLDYREVYNHLEQTEKVRKDQEIERRTYMVKSRIELLLQLLDQE